MITYVICPCCCCFTGNIDIAELHLVPKVEQLVSQFRAAIPPLQRNGVEAGKLASFALEVLKRQVITDLVTGVAGAFQKL